MLNFQANNLSIFAALIELACNFIPTFCLFISFTFKLSMGEALFNYPMVMTGLDSIITASIYRFVIKSKQKNKVNVLTNTTVFRTVPLMFVVGNNVSPNQNRL